MFTRARGARYLTDFDSSVNTVRAVGSYLNGEDHRSLSMGPTNRFLSEVVATRPPDRVRAAIYRVMGFSQGLPLDRARHLDVDVLDEWVTRQYGPGPFPAVVVGCTSGGVVHLAAALGAPFLPQTTLSTVRDLATRPDDAVGAMEALAPTARVIAERNPRVSVYHMHDPAQDRPMLEAMAYMRIKRLGLGRSYERFLEERLMPGGTIIQVECTRDWRSRAVGDRAYFQFGCLGGVSEEEYHDTGERITRYLIQEDSPVRSWQPPESDARRPEAEWGWDPALGGDVKRVAQRFGYRLRRLVSVEPQEQSAFVADLHRWWYRRLDSPTNRLLVECYAQWDPMWMLRTGSVPFWSRFNMEPAYEELERYLEDAEPYDEIYLNLFSQGIESPGVVPVERWQRLIHRHARHRGEVIGVDRDAYPLDAGSTLRYHRAFKTIPSRHPLPAPMAVEQIDDFLEQSRRNYRVDWT
jgi:hypothetical protein